MTRGMALPCDIKEFCHLWEKLMPIHLQQGTEDSILWKFTSDGAYNIQFAGHTASGFSALDVTGPPAAGGLNHKVLNFC